MILDSALSSATESDRAGFQRGAKALELLRTLAGDYWRTLVEGGGDQQGRQHFGKFGFAAKESDTLSVEGKNRRTFRYKGKDLLMEKHLKLGVKDSPAETLRIHFELVQAERLIIIGHCGKHLSF